MDLFNIDQMDGFEFEHYIAELLRKHGFIVEETKKTGDGGIDLLAFSNEMLYKGKYVIQCKRWSGTIGAKEVRDLYGVVLSENANKGLFITNSFFSEQAISFSDGKNIELIDRSRLFELINNPIDKKVSIAGIDKSSFISNSNFETEKFEYYKTRLSKDKRNIANWRDLHNFLISYLENRDMEILFSGVLDELLNTCFELEKLTEKLKWQERLLVAPSHMDDTTEFTLLLLGRFDEVFERRYKYLRVRSGQRIMQPRSRIPSLSHRGITEINMANMLIILSKLDFKSAARYVLTVCENILNYNKLNSISMNAEPLMNHIVESAKKELLSTEHQSNFGVLFLPWKTDTTFDIKQVIHCWPTNLDFSEIEKRLDLLMSLKE